MSQDQQLHDTWLQNPKGLIDPGTICHICGTYNARNMTCNVVAVREEKILLIQRDHEPQKGLWGFPGGYLNWDETVTEAAARELREETGLEAQNLRLIGVRSDVSAADSRQNVDIYFFTDQLSGELQKQKGEVAAVAWFTINELPLPLAFDHERLLKEFLPTIKSGNFVPLVG